ncbi:MAG: hypothetical protein N3I35_05465 [Clostridia bacterium]|nr:hypothetical protein [Clostridia bacterium]
MKGRTNKINGAVTVEACLTFPFFLFFLLTLIFVIKLACIDIVLSHAANETVKQIACAAYPVKFLNQLEDEAFLGNSGYAIPDFSDEIQRAGRYLAEGSEEDTLAMVVSGGNIRGRTLDSVLDKAVVMLKDSVKEYVTGKAGSSYYEIKTKAKYAAAKILIDKFVKGTYVHGDKVEYAFVQLPQSLVEYSMRNKDVSYLKACKDMGFLPAQDDAVIALRYKVRVPVPFFDGREIVLSHVCVEKAWVKGSNGIYSSVRPDGKEGGKEDPEEGSLVEDSYRRLGDETVYITSTGEKYHKADCPCLRSSRRLIKLSDAERKGYGKCRVCSNKGKWNFY